MARQLVKKQARILAWLLALCLPLATQAAAPMQPACMPFVGENMSFDVDWEFINAGSASMHIAAQGEGWQVKTYARTNKVLDLFKKVRDTITAEGLCVNGSMQSTLFEANLHERKYEAKKEARFLWEKNQVRFTQNNVTEFFDVPAGHLSVIDAFLAVRRLQLQTGKAVNVPVFDSRKRYEIVVDIMPEKQRLMAPWGEEVECIVVRPKLKTEGIFASKGEMTLWMTDDEHHIPIRMAAKIKIGSIIARLTGYSKRPGQ